MFTASGFTFTPASLDVTPFSCLRTGLRFDADLWRAFRWGEGTWPSPAPDDHLLFVIRRAREELQSRTFVYVILLTRLGEVRTTAVVGRIGEEHAECTQFRFVVSPATIDNHEIRIVADAGVQRARWLLRTRALTQAGRATPQVVGRRRCAITTWFCAEAPGWAILRLAQLLARAG